MSNTYMTKTSSPTMLLSQINSDYLTCQICMDTYRKPKVLKCQHTFCQSCLGKLLNMFL